MIAVADFQEGPTLNKKQNKPKKNYKIKQTVHVKVLLKVLVITEFMLNN